MKFTKLFFAALAVLTVSSFAFAADKETPGTIYSKIIDNSYVGKYKSIIIDKEFSSTQLPDKMTVKSKTYFAYDMFREETQTKDESGQSVNIVTLFTSSDTYISYDAGENFFSVGASLIENISSNLKNIDPFTPMAVLNNKTETINGADCYVIEDKGDGLNRKFYVEKKTYNVMKVIISNDDVLLVTDMSNYKKVDKYMAPFKMKILVQQKTGEKQTIESEVKITSIQFNPSINKSIFTPKNVTALPDIPGMGDIKDMLQSMF